MKSFFASKINWSGIIIMIMGLLDELQQMDLTAIQQYIATFDFSKVNWFAFIMGLLIVIFRTKFTSTKIKPITKL